jgi:poly(beta-D-mannuronate) lyase
MNEMTCTLGMLEEKLKQAAPGDTVVVEDGAAADVVLAIGNIGEEKRPITIRAKHAGEVLMTGLSTLTLTGRWVRLEGIHFKDCVLDESCVVLEGDDCEVIDCRFTDSGGKRAAISIQGTAAGNTIERCEFAHLEQRSVQVVIRGETAPSENRIVDNCFRDIPPIPSGNGRETIQIGQNQRDWGHVEPKTLVARNRFLRCDGEIEIISNKSSRNFYHNNLFKDCRGELVMRGGSFCEIYGNRHDNCSGGIRLSGTHHTVTHNLILNCPNGFRIPYGMTIEQGGLYQAVTGCTIAYNTVVDSEKVGLNVGTNRMMDRKEMGVAKHPPYENQFVNNVFTSDSGSHLIVTHAPENRIDHNLFAGEAKALDLPDGNSTAAEAGLSSSFQPTPDSVAFDGAVQVEGVAPYPHLGADPDCLSETPTT